MSVLEAAIGWLSPPDCLVCGEEKDILCQSCATSEIRAFGERCWRCNILSPGSKTCPKCRPTGPLSHVWISTNYEAYAQQLVQRYKFGHLRIASKTLAKIMTAAYKSTSHNPKNYLVIPIPTATSRIRERGFDHSEMVAKAVAANLKLEYSGALRRLGQSRQLGSKREHRLTQLANNFTIKKRRQIAGSDILLVDDVLTTGGTLIAAARCLKQAGASRVDALVFAKRL